MILLTKIDDSVARFETWLLVLIVIIMVLTSFSQVILRNFFNTAIEGADIILRHLVLWVGFIGASLATRSNKHISIDIFSRISSHRIKKAAKIIVSLFAMIISFILVRAGYQFVASEFQFETLLFGSIKAWYFEIIIPIGFALIGIRLLLNNLHLILPQDREKI